MVCLLQVTKLVKNYRAHPFIMSLYSRLFYHNELQVCCGESAYELALIPELCDNNKPIIFHGLQVRGLLPVVVIKYLQVMIITMMY